MGMFICWSGIGFVFIVFGIYALHAESPVRFWNIRQKIEVTDIKRYNRAMARMWFGFTVLFVCIGIPLLAGQNSAWIVIPILGGMVWSIGLMVTYTWIEKRYRIMK